MTLKLKIKKIFFKNFLFVLSFLLLTNSLKGQGRLNMPEFEDTVIENKIYRPYSNYLLVSYGVGFNFKQHNSEQAGSISYTFKVKNSFFRIGYSVVSRNFVLSRTLQKINDVTIMYGKRLETSQANFSFFAGLSYSYGTYFYYFMPNELNRKVYLFFRKPGVYVELELTKKIFYDIGTGVSIFGTFNNAYKEYYSSNSWGFYGAVGLKLSVYFSGAYKGEIGYY